MAYYELKKIQCKTITPIIRFDLFTFYCHSHALMFDLQHPAIKNHKYSRERQKLRFMLVIGSNAHDLVESAYITLLS